MVFCHKLVIFLWLVVAMIISAPSLAQESKGATVGMLLGLSVPDAEDTDPIHLDGVTGMTGFGANFQFGGYYLIPGKAEGKDGRKFQYSMHGLQAAYLPGGSGQGTTFFGLRFGLSKVKTKNSLDENLIFSPYHYGIFAGHDYTFWSWLSFGFEGSFYHFEPDRTTQSGVVYTEDAFNVISFMLAFKLSM